jgi:6-phosphogluconolactonase (cycloisomerase 2 family)
MKETHCSRPPLSLLPLFRTIVFAVGLLLIVQDARAGFLYAVNQVSAGANQIYGFSVNESTGALTPLAGFPVSAGGNGINTFRSEQMTIDTGNRRLYVINDESNTLTAFSINGSTGALTALPFSPIALGDGQWTTVSVHPLGSPVIVGDTVVPGKVVSFNITATTATPAAGSPYTAGAAPALSSSFSHDGYFVYLGGGSGNNIAGYSVNTVDGTLTALPGSPFNSGGANPVGFATDMVGRLLTVSAATAGDMRVFTTLGGVPAAAPGNPQASGLTAATDGIFSRNENRYYAADQSGSRVGAYQISGNFDSPTLTPLTGSPVSSGGTLTNSLVMNAGGNFLYAANSTSRNITLYTVDADGILTFSSVQPANTLGSTGRLTGIAYQPSVFTVTNLNDTGAGSLRQAVLDANAVQGGVVIFSSFFNSPRTISLGTGNISIVSNTTIHGPGAHLLTVQNTAAPSSTSRPFFSGANATLIGMTITGGNTTSSGGGILSQVRITVRRCVITGNVAGTTGGGIQQNGIFSLIESTVSGNTANGAVNAAGGIMHFNSLMNVVNSTISGNSAPNGSTSGGGIRTDGGRTRIINSTITNNVAPGSGSFGGVLNQSAGVSFANSIIAANGNNAITPDLGVVGSPVWQSNGFNIIGNRGVISLVTLPSDQAGTSASPVDPRLAPLTFGANGLGTHEPLRDSPAIDKGSSFNYVIDQRAQPRPLNDPRITNLADGSDIGAFERRANGAVLDFDGDGKTDIGIFRPGPGEWWINRSSNGSTFAVQFGAGSDHIRPGDFTGDGKTDIALWRSTTGEWFVLRSEDFSFFSFPFGAIGDMPVPADYDADGKTDAAVFRPLTSTWFIRRSSDSGTTIQAFGTSGDLPIPSDYDGDGRADIAIFRPSLGQWWMNRSTEGVLAVTFGNTNDKLVPGDYTGDGKADVAFWRPSTGNWFILRSEDFSFFSFPFGLNTDLPAPGDYDGDGRHDATVFRPSSATWFSQRTTAGSLVQQFGISSDRPIPNAFVP